MFVLRRLIVLTAALVLGWTAQACAQAVAPVGAEDMTLGSPKAKVVVVEYASGSCPHCARFNNDVFPAFKAKYIDTGKVFYVFREFITPPPELATAVFIIARCAPKDRYFSVIDAAFHAQQKIYDTGDMRTPLVAIAKAAGISDERLTACFNDQAMAKALDARIQSYIEKDKIASTPTFVINGARLQGEQTLATLAAAVEAARHPKVGR